MNWKYIVAIAVAAIVVSTSCTYVLYDRDEPDMPDVKRDVTEAFINHIENGGYETFGAYMMDGDTKVYGIGFTNYSQCYTGGEETYIISGFIPTTQDSFVVRDHYSEEIYKDTPIDGTRFIADYSFNEMMEQLIINGTYVRYGVDANGHFTYYAHKLWTHEGERLFLDEVKHHAIGDISLFDYDSGKYLNYVGSPFFYPVSMTTQEPNSLHLELQQHIDTQMENFLKTNVNTYVSYAKNAYQAYLDSQQGGSIFGYTFEELKQYSSNLSDREFLILTESGLTIGTEPELSETDRWVYGIACLGAIILASLIPATGGLMVAAISAFIKTVTDIFIETAVLGNQPDIVSISIDAAVYILSAIPGAGIAVKCMLGAAKGFVNTLAHNGSLEQALQTAGIGIVVNGVITIASKAISAGAQVVIKGIHSNNLDYSKISFKGRTLSYTNTFDTRYSALEKVMKNIGNIVDKVKEERLKMGIINYWFSEDDDVILERSNDYIPGFNDTSGHGSKSTSISFAVGDNITVSYTSSDAETLRSEIEIHEKGPSAADDVRIIINPDGTADAWVVEGRSLEPGRYYVSYYHNFKITGQLQLSDSGDIDRSIFSGIQPSRDNCLAEWRSISGTYGYWNFC